jgi:hypothetical protein
MNKLRITQNRKPSITPVRGSINKFKIKKNTDKTKVVLVR